MASLIAFFSQLWGGNSATATPTAAEKLGYQYYYDEDGSLPYELGAGGANSTGAAHYVYLPTPAGPMPVAFYNGSRHYAVHTDHLNTPRRLTQSDKKIAWQWAYSAFGEEQPTTGRNRYVDPVTTPNAGSTTIADVTFNLRYPGQYFDKESNLHYNYFRSYDSRTGRYTQADPIDLQGGWNRFAYVESDPLMSVDPDGLKKKAPPIPGDYGKQPYVPDYWRNDTYRRYRDGYYASVCVKTTCEFGSPAGMCTSNDLGGTGKVRKMGPFLSASGQQMNGCQCTEWALDWREGLRPPNNALDKMNLLLQNLGVGGYQ